MTRLLHALNQNSVLSVKCGFLKMKINITNVE